MRPVRTTTDRRFATIWPSLRVQIMVFLPPWPTLLPFPVNVQPGQVTTIVTIYAVPVPSHHNSNEVHSLQFSPAVVVHSDAVPNVVTTGSGSIVTSVRQMMRAERVTFVPEDRVGLGLRYAVSITHRVQTAKVLKLMSCRRATSTATWSTLLYSPSFRARQLSPFRNSSIAPFPSRRRSLQ